MHDYKSVLLAHLANYKSDVLGVNEDGVWSRNKRAYSHILPSEKGELNLVNAARAIWSAIPPNDRPKRHRDFHHLNSSQAFAINLFLPVLYELNAHAPLLHALGVSAQSIEEWQFEAVPDPNERTTFDLALKLPGSRKVFIEVKLTESEFGTVANSATQRNRRDTIYLPRLADKVNPSALDAPAFFKRYQLLRNASYATLDGSEVVFVVPRQNRTVAAAATHFTSEIVSVKYRPVIRTVFAEDLVAALMGADVSPELLGSLADTADKYLLRRFTV